MYTVKVNIFARRNFCEFRGINTNYKANKATVLQKAIFVSFYFCVFVFTGEICENKILTQISTSTVYLLLFQKYCA